MNRYYTYENIKLWERGAWDCKISPMQALARFLCQSGAVDFACKEHETWEPEYEEGADAQAIALGRYISPGVLKKLEEKGLYYAYGAAADPWFVLLPEKVKRQEEHEPKILYVMRCLDTHNPFWTTDLFEEYREYFKMAAEEQMMLLFTITSDPQKVDLTTIMVREISQRFNVNYTNLYMDVSALAKGGQSLRDVPDFCYRGVEGEMLEDPAAAVEKFGALQIPVLNISKQWATCESLEFSNFTPGRIGNLPFSYERLVHSAVGKRMADAMRLEYDYLTGQEEEVQRHLQEKGLRGEYHETNNRGWLTVTPLSAYDDENCRIPCMMIMQEIVKADPHSILSAYSLWYEYLNIAAAGDMMLMFFALEDADSNDIYAELLEEATQMYPFLDRSRVYMTGHSHNGHFTMEFMRRHPGMLAGVATLGNPHGLGNLTDNVQTTEAAIELMSHVDMPVINIDGEWENQYSCKFTANSRARRMTDEQKVVFWQNRLRASRCPMRSAEEILAAAESCDYATRKVGVPNDRSEVIYFEGDECYVADIKNVDGKVHLRVITIENWPHATSAHAPWLSWSFLRRFARDQKSGKLIDLFDIQKL
ncbi:MAG: alpha/beta hydrolase [Eubacteriales bacterium]|nr:alpha/beta hydrolase [Eubacteriales bacterium]